MKKAVKLSIFAVIVVIGLFAVFCAITKKSESSSKKSIVCTTYPEYDWIMNILGDKASSFDVTLLQNKGTDLHSYQPSIEDIAKISKSDIFVYVGGESDEWVEKVIEDAKNKNQITVNMMEVLGDKIREEEIVEGMQAEEEHEHEDEEGEEHEHEHGHHHDEEEAEYDEHVWLSVKNAVLITEALSEKIQKLDEENVEVYKKNTASYVKQLSDLDAEYTKAVNASNKKVLLFGDRYPFRYLSDDYGLKYYAAFVGCSAETEASFKTIIFLANKVDEYKLNSVLTIEKGDKKIAKTIVSNTKNKNQEILEMDSLQSITENEIKNGRTYLSAMKKNLEVLKKALN